MIRGTTPTLEFELPFETSLLAEAWLTFMQNGNIVVDKTLDDCVCDGKTLVLRLTQEETLVLTCGCLTEIQLRVKTVEGDALASDIIRDYMDRILKEGVI